MGYLSLPFICQLIARSCLLPQPLPVVPRLWCPSVQCLECNTQMTGTALFANVVVTSDPPIRLPLLIRS